MLYNSCTEDGVRLRDRLGASHSLAPIYISANPRVKHCFSAGRENEHGCNAQPLKVDPETMQGSVLCHIGFL